MATIKQIEINKEKYDLRDAGAYSLIRGTVINDNDDLNDYMAPGSYICMTTATARTLANSPVTTTGFSLHVEIVSGETNPYLYQTLKANNTSADIYKRSYRHGGSWAEWKQLATTDYALPRDGSAAMTGNLGFNKTDPEIYVSSTSGAEKLRFTSGRGRSFYGGASLNLYNKDSSYPGMFELVASTEENNYKSLLGKPDGTLYWNGKSILHTGNYSNYALPLDGSVAMTGSLNVSNGYGLFRAGKNSAQVEHYPTPGDDTKSLILGLRANNDLATIARLYHNDGTGQVPYNIIHTGNKNLITPADIGALGYGLYEGDIDALIEPGIYRLSDNTNLPNAGCKWGVCFVARNPTYSTLFQIIITYSTSEMYFRGGGDALTTVTWGEWKKTATTDYAVNKAGDTMTGNLNFFAGNNDRFITWKYNNTDDTASWRLGYIGSGTGNANYFVIESTDADSGDTWKRAVQIGLNTMGTTFGGNVTAPAFLGATNYGVVRCSTVAATAAKVGSTQKFDASSNRYLTIVIENANSVAGAITLNINSSGAKPIYINGAASSADNHTLPAGTYFVYYNGTNYYFRTDGAIQGGSFIGVASQVKVSATTSATKYYLVGASGTDGGSTETLYKAYNASGTQNKTGCYFSGSTGVLYGAAWNDYAEYRTYKGSDEIPYGRVVVENGDDTLSLSTERMQLGGNICSDTFGFAIGETDSAKLPIAVSGRVLAYTNEPRESYKPGEALCSGPNGTVSKMTREEIREWPDAIIGYVSAVPSYDTWGTGNVEVNGRIWVKIK